MNIDAVLPAGGRIHGSFAEEAGSEVKALITLGGKTILERIIDVLRATGRVRHIVVIGPDKVAAGPAACGADVVLPEGDSGPSNIFRGLDWLRDTDGGSNSDRVLILTTDLPLLTPEAVIGFIDASPPDKDICLPLVCQEEFETRFPDLSLTYVKLHDGSWTIGCGFLVNPLALVENRDLIERVFAARKSHILMARLLGPTFILRYLLGRVTVPDIEARCLQLLGCTGIGIRGCAPELALDIDSPVDYHYAKMHLTESEKSV